MKLIAKLLWVLVPIAILGVVVEVALTPWWLEFEYGRSGFPTDQFGMTQELRSENGQVGLAVVRGDLSVYRANFELQGGVEFNRWELAHLRDVAQVLVKFRQLWSWSLVGVLMLWWFGQRRAFWRGVLGGGVVGLGALLTVGLGGVLAWEWWFEWFHQMLFAEGTWLFYEDDLLIRLYPEQFWFDSMVLVATTTIAMLFVFTVLARFKLKKKLF